MLIPFDNPAGFGPAIANLLGDETGRLAMGRKAYAATLLGLAPYCAVYAEDYAAAHLRAELADRLEKLLSAWEGPEWTWFENGLSYDNARLPQALIVTGAATRRRALRSKATSRWMLTSQ